MATLNRLSRESWTIYPNIIVTILVVIAAIYASWTNGIQIASADFVTVYNAQLPEGFYIPEVGIFLIFCANWGFVIVSLLWRFTDNVKGDDKILEGLVDILVGISLYLATCGIQDIVWAYTTRGLHDTSQHFFQPQDGAEMLDRAVSGIGCVGLAVALALVVTFIVIRSRKNA